MNQLEETDKVLANMCANLKKLRKDRGIPQRQAAKAAGIGVQMLRKIEHGTVSMRFTADKLLRLCDLYQATPDQVIFDKNER